tara:strand:+ start:244 stop:552 length:309 start_codon:yes stop_codon:yes gene_type:complete
MSNSDYLLRATVKKLSEKLNQTFYEKIEDATNAAQGVPEIIKKELDILKEEILKEAKRMENSEGKHSEKDELEIKNNSRNIVINKIKDINRQLEILNNEMDD